MPIDPDRVTLTNEDGVIRFILKEFLILMKELMFINFKWIQLVQAKIVI